MSWSRFTSILFAIVVVAPLTHANAQEAKDVVRDPANPKTAVPPVRYESAFTRYRANAETDVGVWRETNDNVGRIGGWRIYGREAIEEPKADKPPAAGSQSEGGAAAKAGNGQAHRRVQ